MNLYGFLYEFAPLLSFLFSVFLIVLLLRSDWKRTEYRTFALFLLAMGLWGFTIFGMRSSPHDVGGADLAFAWEKAVIAIIPGVAVLFYHFTLQYTRTRPPFAVLPVFYLTWAAFAILGLFGLVVSEMKEESLPGSYLGWSAEFTGLGSVYVAAAYVPVLLGMFTLASAYRHSMVLEEKNRIIYMLAGATASLLGGTSDFLFAKGVIFYPFGIVGNILFALLTTVAILRYRLLELRAVLRKGAAYTLMGILIVGLYGAVFVLFNYIFREQSASARLLASLAAAVIVAIALQPLLGRLQGFVDRLFYRKRYDHLKALQGFSQETRNITDLKSLSSSLTDLVTQAMQANSACLLLPEEQSGFFQVASATGVDGSMEVRLRPECPMLIHMKGDGAVVTRRDLETIPQLQAMPRSEKQLLESLGGEIFVPLNAKDKLTGFLAVGQKLTEQDYSSEGVDLLSAAVNQAAMAIENARLYTYEAERVQELERIEALRQNLLLTVAHEIKTPLTTIKAGAEMIASQDDAPPTSAKGRLYKSITRGVDRLERLVGESLDYAKMQSSSLDLDLEEVALNEVIDEVVGLSSPPIKARRQTLEVSVPDSLPLLRLDRMRFERVLVNLLSNAQKFTQIGGEIALTVEAEETYVIISVKDNGPGIPENDQDKIFGLYYRAENADGRAAAGTGLGLTIAKYLTELHNGRIWLESEVGKGTTFYVSLPVGGADDENTSD